MRLEAREYVPDWLKFFVPLSAVMIAMAMAAILLILAGAPPIESFYQLIKGAFGSKNSIAETGARATPLILTGLAAGIAFKAKFWNIGAEGQLYAGAIAVTIAGTGLIQLPSILMIPFICLIGFIAGAIIILPSVILKQLFKVDEVVTTLLMNFIVLLFVSFVLEGPLKDPMSLGWPQGASIIYNGMLPQIMERTRLHLGFVI